MWIYFYYNVYGYIAVALETQFDIWDAIFGYIDSSFGRLLIAVGKFLCGWKLVETLTSKYHSFLYERQLGYKSLFEENERNRKIMIVLSGN